MQNEQIAVRAYVIPANYNNVSRIEDPNFKTNELNLMPSEFEFVLDSETSLDRYQNLKFGCFQVYRHSGLYRKGVFYNPEMISRKERLVLLDYCVTHKIEIIPVRDFVDKIFLPYVFDLRALCIGFNLPFDLSRLALSWGYARGRAKGGFSFKLTDKMGYPRLIIKHIDSAKAFIRFGRVVGKFNYEGRFVDVRTLTHALTNEKLSLKGACELYNTTTKKIEVELTGKITSELIDYCMRDVESTYAVFRAAKKEFDLFDLDMPIEDVYSSASIGKDVLKMMGIQPFSVKNHIPPEILGYVTTTYIGGRSEVPIRKTPTLVTLLDFLSMYPTIAVLMQLWEFLICDHVEYEDCTEDVIEFVRSSRLNDFRHPNTWTQLNAIVELEPEDDLLPTRARYTDKYGWNVALNYITSKQKLWFALSDVVNDRLQTGKIPKITRAIRFKPVGRQKGLRKIKLFGEDIDPSSDNFFKWIIERRQKLKDEYKKTNDRIQRMLLDKKQKGLKTIASSTSYGIYVQVNTFDEETEVSAFGLTLARVTVPKKEEFGYFHNPIVATLITSGARLVLGLVERILAAHGEMHSLCDTDSMAIPYQHKEEVQCFFKSLNPYDLDVEMFKVEEYEDEDNVKRPLEKIMCYGISTKRYAMYRIDELNEITILKASSHGLKNLLSPLGNKSDNNWHKEVWLDILRYHYGKVTLEELDKKYGSSYAVAQMNISSAHVMNTIAELNCKKSYAQQIKPFNFCIVGVGNQIDTETGEIIKPLSPYSKDAQLCPFDNFIDYKTGNVLNGTKYWKRFADSFWDYVMHPEAKFEGETGVLKRRHLSVTSAVHIGKESNNLTETEVLGLDGEETVSYSDEYQFIELHKDIIFSAKPKHIGVPGNHLLYIKKVLRAGKLRRLRKKTLDLLSNYIKKVLGSSTILS